MARINLLPWREELKKEKQQEFIVTLFLSAILALAVVALGWFHMSNKIDNQLARNAYLEDQIKVLDKQIKEIKNLEKQKSNLLARMNIIQQLQRSRPEVVHIFDAIVRTLPEGLYLTSIKNSDKSFTFSGFAESNARVSTYMRNIDSSKWLASPSLKIIQKSSAKANERTTNQFTLTATQRSTDADKNKK